jgi:hypothetical protein
MNRITLGTVSHATMRPEDLIPCFIGLLKELDTNKEYTSVIEEGEQIIDYNGQEKDDLNNQDTDTSKDWDSENVSMFLNEDLWEALNDFSPPYCYFGAHPGDGSDYGYWPCEIEETLQEFEGLKVKDLSEVPDNYSGEVFLVNDHGNVTFYECLNGNVTEIWSTV